MLTIHLQDLEFYSYHGLHPEERITGGYFIVSMDVETSTGKEIHDLGETVDYSKIYDIIRVHMDSPRLLLEQVAQDISKDVANLSASIKKTRLSIFKKNPPIPKCTGRVGVTLSLDW